MTKPLSILYVTAVPLASATGPALHVTHMLEAMVARGHSATVIQPGAYENPHFSVICIAPPTGLLAGTRLRRRLAAATASALNVRSYDVLYMRGSLLGTAKAAKAKRLPLAVEYNGVLMDEMALTGQSRMSIWRHRASEAAVARLVDAAIAVDGRTAERMQALYPALAGKLTVCANGAATDAVSGLLSRREECRARWCPPGVDNLGCFVGTVFSWTDLETPLAALASLPGSYGAVIVAAGAGAADAVRERVAHHGVAGRVRVSGAVTHQEALGLMVAADYGLALSDTSVAAGSPLKLAEYLAAGCVPIATERPELAWLERESLGVLAAARSPEAVEQAIVKACGPMGAAGQRAKRSDYARGRLSWAATAVAVEQVLLKLCSPSGAA